MQKMVPALQNSMCPFVKRPQAGLPRLAFLFLQLTTISDFLYCYDNAISTFCRPQQECIAALLFFLCGTSFNLDPLTRMFHVEQNWSGTSRQLDLPFSHRSLVSLPWVSLIFFHAKLYSSQTSCKTKWKTSLLQKELGAPSALLWETFLYIRGIW